MPAAMRTVHRHAQLGNETVGSGGRYQGQVRPMRQTSDAFLAHVHVSEPPCDLRRLAGKHSRYHLCRELGVACLHATMYYAPGRAAMRQEVRPPIREAQAVTKGLSP